jgi:CRISPR-associated endonuclease/helicase Cas3
LLLLSPDPVADPAADWLGGARTRFVYNNPAILWRSAHALLSAGSITTPDNIRALVEAAYG